MTGHEIVMPNAMVKETDLAFDARVRRNRARPGDYGTTSVFRNLKTGENVVLGNEALMSGQPVRITGPDKYEVGALDNMILSALLKFAPDGHPNVIVSCAHTTDAVAYTDKMAAILNGKHSVERHDGEKVDYRVRAFIPWDEPVGGILRFAERNYVEDELEPGEKIIVWDFGGRISSGYPAMVLPGGRIEVYWSVGKSFELGIQQVFEQLVQELRGLYPDTFKMKTIPEALLEEALTQTEIIDGQMHHFIPLRERAARGEKYQQRDEPAKGRQRFDVTQAVLNSTGRILDGVRNVYVNNLNSGADIDHIVVTGGGGGRLFDMLRSEVFGYNAVHLAEEPDCMHLANLRGGLFATKVWMTTMDDLSREIKGRTVPPLYLIIDPGNQNLKATVIGYA